MDKNTVYDSPKPVQEEAIGELTLELNDLKEIHISTKYSNIGFVVEDSQAKEFIEKLAKLQARKDKDKAKTDSDESFKAVKKVFSEWLESNENDCPRCGRCPLCGRSSYEPLVPYERPCPYRPYPYEPCPYDRPTGPVWVTVPCNGTAGANTYTTF